MPPRRKLGGMAFCVGLAFMPKQRQPRSSPAVGPVESRPAEAFTVGWLLSVFTTLLCLAGALLSRWIGAGNLPVLAGLLMFAALVIGAMSIALGLLVQRLRTTPAPRGVFVFAMVVGALPAVAMLIDLLV